MRDRGAVLDHEGPLAPSCERSSAVASQNHQRGPRLCVGAMCAGRSTFQSSPHHEAALIDRTALLRLILRRVRQRAFVIFDPPQLAQVEIAAARHTSEIMFGLWDVPPVGALADEYAARSRLVYHRCCVSCAARRAADHGFPFRDALIFTRVSLGITLPARVRQPQLFVIFSRRCAPTTIDRSPHSQTQT